jgi:hypothetical protein
MLDKFRLMLILRCPGYCASGSGREMGLPNTVNHNLQVPARSVMIIIRNFLSRKSANRQEVAGHS